MICVKNTLAASMTVKVAEVRRISDNEAKRLVATQEWQYCPKSEWKKAGRPRG